MNELIKNSIDARKNAVYGAYNITDDKVKNEINELFNKIEDFGKQYDDLGEFETAFASSPLNQEYINIFTKIATKFSAIEYQSDEVNSKSRSDEIKEEIASDAKYLVDDLTHPARHALREEADSKIRDIPVVGDAIQAKQTFDLFKRFKKNKNEDE